MGVYIKGMEMPTEGYIDVRIKCNGTVSFSIANNPYIKVVEAVPVPPHGRLIDADAMIRDLEKSIVPSWYIKERNADMVKFLSLEDTIIPAEEGE